MMSNYQIERVVEGGTEYEVWVRENGDREWLLNGKCRREDGPAIEHSTGYRAWYLNGHRHREDGPAMEWCAGSREWYWHGVQLTKEVQEQGIDQLSPEEIRFWLPILAAQTSDEFLDISL